MTIYDDILANISQDKKAWCQGSFCVREDGEGDIFSSSTAKPVSRCLVEHIDLALGTAYVKPNGKVFVSKDKRKWARRTRVLRNLVSLLPSDLRSYTEANNYRVVAPSEVDTSVVTYASRYYGSYAAADLIDFNDDEGTTKTKVRNLLKKASKAFPED